MEKKTVVLWEEVAHYYHIWDVDAFGTLLEVEIKSGGNVVHTLEAALWCFLNQENYKDCALKAVNLGSDTDTVGAVAGDLAGLYYGEDEIPEEWTMAISS